MEGIEKKVYHPFTGTSHGSAYTFSKKFIVCKFEIIFQYMKEVKEHVMYTTDLSLEC